jgi:hypothetical protein
VSARTDADETTIAVALHACRPRTVRGATYTISAYSAAVAIGRLRRIARTLQGLYERACCYPVIACAACSADRHHGPSHTPSHCHYARVESIQARADLIAAELGVTIEHQTDPRGAPIVVWTGAPDTSARLGYLP